MYTFQAWAANIKSSTISYPAAETKSTLSLLESASGASTLEPRSASADQLTGKELPIAVCTRMASLMMPSKDSDKLRVLASEVADS